jgi:ATP-dependent Clp protease ATP-binding subunit ClpC
LQNFVGQKDNKPGQVDISGILSKYLSIPNFQFIAITDYVGFHKNIEANPSFAEFFRKIEVTEVTELETVKILQVWALEFEYKNKILILYPSIREIVNLTARYMPSLPFPKKAIDVLDEAVVYVQTLKEKVVFPHHIAEIISKKTEIPVGKMETKEKEVLLNLENLIHQRIVNQKEAVKEISVAMRRARSGLSSKKRPMGSFLFMGPTGVGKTETSKALAQIYFNGEDKIIRIDMSEFQAISDIPRLIGSVSPVEMQGLLTTPVRETPFSLVLLDEVEKAHPNILNLLLQVLDEGHITDGQGRKVVFTNTIIICTSNAGADIIFNEVESGKKIDKDQFIQTIIGKGIFKPELVNRFDATVVFHSLTKENLLQIAQLSLQSLQKNLKEKEIDFEITEPLKEKIVGLSYKPEFGAREMRRVIQNKVENSIAEALLSDKLKKTDKFEIDPETFELIINSAL